MKVTSQIAGTLCVLGAGLLVRIGLVHAHSLSGFAFPYTVTVEESIQAPTSTSTVAYTTAFRADGSRVLKNVRRNTVTGRIVEIVRTINTAQGKQILTDDIHLSKSTTNKIGGWTPMSLQNRPGNNCLTDLKGKRVWPSSFQVVGQEPINGYLSLKVQGQTPDSLDTYWFAVDYGCAILQADFAWKDGVHSQKRLVSLVSGSPDPALFKTDGYAEIRPSQVLCGSSGTCGSAASAMWSRLDDAYNRQALAKH